MKTELAQKTITNAICTFILLALLLAYPWIWATSGNIAQCMLSFSIYLVCTLMAHTGMFVVCKFKNARLNIGGMLIVASVFWFAAPYSYVDFWAVNPRMIDDALANMFRNFQYNYNINWVYIVGTNLFWFMIFAVGIALVRSSPIWANMLRSDGMQKNKPKSAFGGLPDAKLEDDDVVKAAFSKPGGIVIGEMTDPYSADLLFNERDMKTWNAQGTGQLLTMNPTDGNGHVLVISESGGFKTSGLIIANLIAYAGPAVVHDPKMDLYKRCAPIRQRNGFETILVDEKNGLDPLSILVPLIEKQHSLLLYVAKALITDSGKGDVSYFEDRSRDLFVALLYHFLMVKKSRTALLDIMNLLAGSYKEVQEQCAAFAKEDLPKFARNGLLRVAAVDEKYWESIPRIIANSLYFSEFEEAASIVTNVEGSDRHLRVLDPKTDVFFNVSSELQRSFTQLLRLAVTAILTGAKQTETPERPSCRRLFLIDEAKNLGSMDVLELVRDEGRAYGLHLMLFYQSYGQMEKIWQTRSAVAAWEDSIAVQIVGAAQSDEMSGRISRRLGKTMLDVVSDSTSTSSQHNTVMKGQTTRGTQASLREVDLMTPQQVQLFPRQGSIIFSRKCKPFLATKAIYYTRKDMWDKISPPDGVVAEDPANRSLIGKAMRRWNK